MPHDRIAVLIATTGRPLVLTETLREVAAQTRAPDRILVCPATEADVSRVALASLPCPIEIVDGAIGSSHQRNALLRAAGDIDIALIVDDDFLLAPNYLEELAKLFATHPECMIVTGRVLADGATNRGYTVAEGRAILRAPYAAVSTVAATFNGYGCNMAVRWSTLRDKGVWFDEQLPLYAWGEDVDFSRQASLYGTVLKADALVGVHLAWKQGRTSGVRFGYSQVANQVYLAHKGTVTRLGAMRKAAENIAANVVGACRRTESFVDRRGRLVGNLLAIRDLVTGRSSPRRIHDL